MKHYSTSLRYGRQRIEYEVMYARRKTMEIAVHPDARVLVKAPEGTRAEDIEARMLKRARWIRRQLTFFQQFVPRTPPRQYVGGETHLYLGRQYRLKLRKSKEIDVKLKGAYFYVKTPDPHDKQTVKGLLDDWFKEHALPIFYKRLELCYAKVKNLKVQFPQIKLKKMTKRWGSCSKSGDILLNTKLIKAPLYSIDYVIMHELCHLKIHSHNKQYFNLLSKYMPDWEKRKERLERAVL